MRQESSSHGRGSVGEVLFVLVFVLIVATLLIRPCPRRDYARHVKQRAQLHSIKTALELHSNEFEGYPPSDANDPLGVPYCGALKLAEAVMGQDLLGAHCESVFRGDGLDGAGVVTLYPNNIDALDRADRDTNLKARRGPYLHAVNANAYRLVEIYGKENTGPFPEDAFVLCDTYGTKTACGERTGTPILCYRAHADRTAHDANDPNNPENIYDYRDNHALVCLGVPGEPNVVHPLSDPRRFYMNTRSDKNRTESKPYNADSFLLISAGEDGLYGTRDDICNFEWKYRE